MRLIDDVVFSYDELRKVAVQLPDTYLASQFLTRAFTKLQHFNNCNLQYHV